MKDSQGVAHGVWLIALTDTNVQIHKYKCTNTQIQMYKYTPVKEWKCIWRMVEVQPMEYD